MKKILVVDDEKYICNSLKEVLEYENYDTEVALSAEEGIAMVTKTNYDLIISDIKMNGMDGVEFLKYVKREINSDIPFVMISGHGNINLAVDCIKQGAFDFIEKPLDVGKILSIVRNVFEKYFDIQKATTKNNKKDNEKHSGYIDNMIGKSEKMNTLKKLMMKVAVSEARVLITGNNGTGKEMVARVVHELSHRSKAPFVEVNCAAIPGELIESDMFGHEKGSFTSAVKQKKGKFEIADGGTLFLDEIGDMSLQAQAKVLRVLQESKICRVGGEKDISVDVRVLAATNKNLKEEIAKGNFREDLYHRLCVIHLHVPSLNSRREDIPLLINHFLKEIIKRESRGNITIDDKAIELLQNVDWTGNIRELINIIERLTVLTAPDDKTAEVLITSRDVTEYVLNVVD